VVFTTSPDALGGSGTEGDQRLARVDGDPQLKLGFLLHHPVADRNRCTDRALRIVLVRNRGAEERHDGVADELLHSAAEALELQTQAAVIGRKERAHVLRVELLGARGEADQVGEEHGDDLPLLAPGRLERERRTAGIAESRAATVLMAADRTSRHAGSVRPCYCMTSRRGVERRP
jgi:hypothetical protein